MQSTEKPAGDVLVVGAGPGGATLAYALAKAGRQVMVIERGADLSRDETLRGMPPETTAAYQTAGESERRRLSAAGGRCTDTFTNEGSGQLFVPFVGCGTGGSSSLYGMALERRYRHDFEGWPVSYDEMAPWYAEAERLYEVQGSPDPLRAVEAGCLAPGVPLSEANAMMFGHLESRGLHPYRQHVACRRVAGCGLCQSYLCAQAGCKRDARTVCLEPAIAGGRVRLLAEAEVAGLEASAGHVTAAVVKHRGETLRVAARVFVVAAGALSTPRLLARSGLAQRSGLLGRRLMRHAIDLFVLALGPRHAEAGEAKELALNDYYAMPGQMLGTVQAFGMAPTLEYLRNKPGRNLWKMLGPAAVPVARLFARAPIVAGILADEPSADNGVMDGPRGPHLRYRLGALDQNRRLQLRRRILRAFARYGPVRVFGTSELPALGHVCGTAMFGERPENSVLDRYNRVHEMENLYVTDASFFPTSGGVNPALTVMANALRVAHHLEAVL